MPLLYRQMHYIGAACDKIQSVRRCSSGLVVGLVLATVPAVAQEVKSLDWSAFSMDARLDSTGTLLVRERQTILFTGDWNGGERPFYERQRQRFVI